MGIGRWLRYPRAAVRRYYDPQGRRLVYAAEEATPEFWDARWRIDDEELRRRLERPGHSFTVPVTRRYLAPAAGPILEGGCGRAIHVAALERAGYRVVGLDSAEQTVAAVRRVAPGLDVRVGDVRAIDAPDGAFAGYWSIGVIEHFYEGYAPILDEAARVLRPGGVFFLVFPHMSPLRRLRAALGTYPRRTDRPDGFYQFALDPKRVRRDVEARGFALLSSRGRAGVHGLYEELGVLGRIVDPVRTGRAAPVRLLRGGLSWGLSPLCGHSILQVYRRTGTAFA